jgi:signal transduction histidine kinase/tetratricopeptide (TPR) repeat protein
MTKRIWHRLHKYRLLMMLLPVIIPGLIISGFGLLSISRQERAKELELVDSYSIRMHRLLEDVERDLDALVTKPFQLLANKPINLSAVESVQQVLKDILLQNPLVMHPFLIGSDGGFIFPQVRKGKMAVPSTSYGALKNKEALVLFRKGERLELSEGKMGQALKYYLQCLKYDGIDSFKPYLFNAIARSYFKLGKIPQAVSYYRDIIVLFASTSKRDLSLYIPVLRQTAFCYMRMKLDNQAVHYYLQLYEEILQAEASGNWDTDAFAFFKNEALEFLDRHIPASRARRDRLRRARSLDDVPQLSDLEKTLRWRYFDSPIDITLNGSLDGGEQHNKDALRFDKIRQFFLAYDSKTQFYNTIKQLQLWQRADSTSLQQVEIKNPVSGKPAAIVFARMKSFLFGFILSPSSLGSFQMEARFRRHINNPDLKVMVLDNIANRTLPKEALDYAFPLLELPFKRFFKSNVLALFASKRDFFRNRVRQDIRLNYILISAFILALLLGIYLFYKYLTRETELVRLKSQFTDSASHTLKTPLTRIRMLVEKLQLGWVTEETKKQEYFETILSETDRMSDMISNMLDFSKIEAGARKYQFQQGSLQKIVSEAVESYNHYIHGLGFRLTVYLSAEVPPFKFDREAVQLMIFNLLQNAVKYSLNEKYLNIRLTYETQDNCALLMVEDRGIGMAARELKKIFHRFYRAHDRRIQNIEGSGLGLYLVRHSVKAHGGEIKVTSSMGKGTIFKIYLPCR